MPNNKLPLNLLIFNLFYLSFSAFVTQQKSNWEFALYIGVVVIIMGVIVYLHKRFSLDPLLLWLMSFWGLAHMAGGLLEVPISWPTGGETKALYNLWLINGMLKFDQLVHAYGFGLCTWLLWDILRAAIARRTGKHASDIIPTFGLLFLCALGAMGLGALNEVIEFLVTLVVSETNVGGYINTGWDLFFNMVGALLVCFGIWLTGKNRNNSLNR